MYDSGNLSKLLCFSLPLSLEGEGRGEGEESLPKLKPSFEME